MFPLPGEYELRALGLDTPQPPLSNPGEHLVPVPPRFAAPTSEGTG